MKLPTGENTRDWVAHKTATHLAQSLLWEHHSQTNLHNKFKKSLTENGKMTNEEKVMPEKTFRAGGVTATIWKKEIEKDGNKIELFNTTVERSYKEKDDWKKTSNMGVNDLPKVALVSKLAYEFIVCKTKE